MTNGKCVLVVEDEKDLADMLAHHLRREGYDCRIAGDGQAAWAEVQRRVPDVIILDRMLPKMSGDELAARLKRDSRCAGVPVIMLTAKTEETDELVGFALGADDYVTKPFSMKRLLARVAAVLRRRETAAEPSEVLTGGPITLDRGRYDVTVDGKPIVLTATEFRLLGALMAARGRVLSREQLLDSVLGYGVAVTQRTIDVHVAALRKKLGDAANWVQTVRGVGYTFRPPPSEAAED